MQRKKYIQRKVPLQRKAPAQGPEAPVKWSGIRRRFSAQYQRARKEFFQQYEGGCQIGREGICTWVATDLHHPGGRAGEAECDVQGCVPCCRPCHEWAEKNPAEAKQLNFSKSRL